MDFPNGETVRVMAIMDEHGAKKEATDKSPGIQHGTSDQDKDFTEVDVNRKTGDKETDNTDSGRENVEEKPKKDRPPLFIRLIAQATRRILRYY